MNKTDEKKPTKIANKSDEKTGWIKLKMKKKNYI